MFFIMIILILTAIAGFSLSGQSLKSEPTKKNDNRLFLFLLLGGLALRVFGAVFYYGFKTDVNDFLAWSDMLFRNGIPAFYASDAFTDYPPGYMYVLWVIGWIKNTFAMPQAGLLLLVKMPAILSDAAISLIFYHMLKKKSASNACLLPALFIFNPVSILNSSLWGQVDSVLTLVLVITILLLSKKRIFAAYFAFALSIFIKPQALMYAPLLIYAFFVAVHHRFSFRKLTTHLLFGSSALLMILLLSLPFGLRHILHQYVATLSSYPYLSVNAFNLWAALGENWGALTPVTSAIGTFFLAAITLASFYILHKNKEPSKYFYAAAFLCFSTFMLSVRMHERYAYPAMVFMLFALNRDRRRYRLYILLTLSQFFNSAYVLFFYASNPAKYYNNKIILAASLINLLIYLYFAFASDRINQPLPPKQQHKSRTLEKSAAPIRLSRCDITLMATITLIYSVIGFSALGDRSAPQNDYLLKPRQDITLTLQEPAALDSLTFFLGAFPLDESRVLTVTVADQEGQYVRISVENNAEVFYWSRLDLDKALGKTVILSANRDISLKEIALLDPDGGIIPIVNQADYPALFDEQALIPQQQTYMNSTYFDEIYHARTAYEFIHRLPVYEWTHPPLGKVLIALGIRLFGMNPFGWRCVGVLFGILMIPLIYILSKLLLKKTWICGITTLLFTFDFMHYTQTRIATIDSYVTFFIMLMYLFIFRYAMMSFYDTSLKRTLISLLGCGLSAGLAIACKWTGVYAAVGVAVIFFMTIITRYAEYRNVKAFSIEADNRDTTGILPPFLKSTTKTLLFCCICFIVIPILIYLLSYIPYLRANGEGIQGILKNQIDIFTYHSETVAASKHAYASPWYSWPVIARPIWYYSNSFPDGKKAGISAFGNPLIWWAGIAALIFCLYRAIAKKDKTALLLTIAYAANYLPWVAVTRTTFIYHYFPSVPFTVLMIGYSILKLYERTPKIKKAVFVYTACVLLLFLAFYPVLTGIPVDPKYVTTFLRWLPGWVLI